MQSGRPPPAQLGTTGQGIAATPPTPKATAQDRTERVESLVVEMRAGAKSLKRRLDSDIREQGISDE